eukprot:9894-Heterococcus_DN1.PRE.2
MAETCCCINAQSYRVTLCNACINTRGMLITRQQTTAEKLRLASLAAYAIDQVGYIYARVRERERQETPLKQKPKQHVAAPQKVTSAMKTHGGGARSYKLQFKLQLRTLLYYSYVGQSPAAELAAVLLIRTSSSCCCSSSDVRCAVTTSSSDGCSDGSVLQYCSTYSLAPCGTERGGLSGAAGAVLAAGAFAFCSGVNTAKQ